jgi:hypothetical protein
MMRFRVLQLKSFGACLGQDAGSFEGHSSLHGHLQGTFQQGFFFSPSEILYVP